MSEVAVAEQSLDWLDNPGAEVARILRKKFEGELRYRPPKRESRHHPFILGEYVGFDDEDLALCFAFGGVGTEYAYDAAMKVVMTADGRAIHNKKNTAVGPMFGSPRTIFEIRQLRAVTMPYDDEAGRFADVAGQFDPMGRSEKHLLAAGLRVLDGDTEDILSYSQFEGRRDTQSIANWMIWADPGLALTDEQLRFR